MARPHNAWHQLEGGSPTTKRCKLCKKVKQLTEFGLTKTVGRRFYRRSHCSACEPHLARYNKHGLTQLEYEIKYNDQQGTCPICLRELPKLSVDHNHNTGVYRGLLCGPCNAGLGHFHDNPTRLLRAIRYLRWHAAI